MGRVCCTASEGLVYSRFQVLLLVCCTGVRWARPTPHPALPPPPLLPSPPPFSPPSFPLWQVIREKVTHVSRGYGFVSFAHPAYATVAMHHMHGQLLYGPFGGQRLKVSASNKRF